MGIQQLEIALNTTLTNVAVELRLGIAQGFITIVMALF